MGSYKTCPSTREFIELPLDDELDSIRHSDGEVQPQSCVLRAGSCITNIRTAHGPHCGRLPGGRRSGARWGWTAAAAPFGFGCGECAGILRFSLRSYLVSASAASTSWLCLEGFTAVQTLEILPAGSMRNVLREAIPWVFSEPYRSTTVFSASASSLKVRLSLAQKTL